MSHDGKYAITPNNGDETISIIDLQANKVAATLEAGPDMTGVNFAAGKAFVISSTSGFVYVYDMKTLQPARPHQDRHEHPARDRDHRYRRPEALSRRLDRERGRHHRCQDRSVREGHRTSVCFHGARTSWTARTTTATDALTAARLLAVRRVHCWRSRCLARRTRPAVLPSGRLAEHTRLRTRPSGTNRSREAQAADLTLTLSTRVAASDSDVGPHGGHDRQDRQDSRRLAVRARSRAGQGRAARSRVPAQLEVVDVSGEGDARVPRAGGVVVEATLTGAGPPERRALRHGNRRRTGTIPVGPERSHHRRRRQARRLRADAARAVRAARRFRPAFRASSTRRSSTASTRATRSSRSAASSSMPSTS